MYNYRKSSFLETLKGMRFHIPSYRLIYRPIFVSNREQEHRTCYNQHLQRMEKSSRKRVSCGVRSVSFTRIPTAASTVTSTPYVRGHINEILASKKIVY